MRTEFARLLKQLKKHQPDRDLELVRQAYRVADRAHANQKRLSGDPYVSHCLAVARILAAVGLDTTTVAAALLHDVIEDTPLSRHDLEEQFGEEVAALVDGVTKIGTLHMASDALPTREQKQAENLRKMLIATAKDVRVILIKLADRLHNMRTIQYLPEEKTKRICRETLDIYAPLALRLGISQWRWELEDHAFHYLNPDKYRELAKRVALKRREREAQLNETVHFLEDRLAEAEVSGRVFGRPKHLYSIYRKMQRQGKDFDEVMDIQAVRIITQTEAGCYNALGVVHRLWPPVPGRFKDYIAMPKANMYQSIHTTVMRGNGHPLEVQIRTEDMDRTAREGIPAHWRYKEGDSKLDAKLDAKLQWLRQMYEWIQDAPEPEELLDNVRRDFKVMDVYVFTPKGEVKELPAGATPLDFAYMVHSDIGHQCIGARVNGRLVSLRYNLQTGDVVEILASKNQTPHRDWVDIVATGRARSRIRQRLRELGRWQPEEETGKPASAPAAQVQEVDDATRSKLIRIEGGAEGPLQFARCCNPMPGQPVVAYLTKSSVVSIHHAACKNFNSTPRDAARVRTASWAGEGLLEAMLTLSLNQRPNMLADLSEATRALHVDITHARLEPAAPGQSRFECTFQAPDAASAERVALALKSVAGVTELRVQSIHPLETEPKPDAQRRRA